MADLNITKSEYRMTHWDRLILVCPPSLLKISLLKIVLASEALSDSSLDAYVGDQITASSRRLLHIEKETVHNRKMLEAMRKK